MTTETINRTKPVRKLRAVPGKNNPESSRCVIAVQAICAGFQDLRVLATSANASANGTGHIALRVGRVLVYLEDRDSMNSWVAAVQRAVELQDHAFGPVVVPPYRLKR